MASCLGFLCALPVMAIIATATSATDHNRPRTLQSRQQDPDELTNLKTFHSRSFHASISVGKYLYIDGGEVVFNDNGTVVRLPENSTYSIDMSSSWTNQTVTLNRIAKSAPVLNRESLWEDASNTSFYAYNGDVSQALPWNELPSPPANSLWQFTPSDNLGSWSEVNVVGTSNFSSLVRTTAGLSAYGNGIGYTLGGVQGWRTSTAFYYDTSIIQVVPDIVSYDSRSQTWLNRSATAFTTYGTATGGALQYVSGFGQAGLLVALGGQNPGRTYPGDQSSYLPMDPINLFDPVSGTWATQRANGTIPPPREAFCTVGVQGDKGTFEIFAYGGSTSTDSEEITSEEQMNILLDSVYVLSLPAFTWAKSNYTPAHPRCLHTCNLVGNRQMVVVGGQAPYPMAGNWTVDINAPDIWPQGLGVFDLSNMEWQDQYNASASSYVTPDVIKTWYQRNGRTPALGWDNPIVETWFTASSTSGNTTGNSTSPSGSRPSGTTMNKSSDTGAIVGGVVGGVVGAALIGLLVWYLLRRHRRRLDSSKTMAGPGPDYSKAELDVGTNNSAPGAAPYYQQQNPVELSDAQRLAEAPGNARYELQ